MDNYMITTENLTGGEKVSLGALEITSVPHFSIIDDKAFSSAEVTDKYIMTKPKPPPKAIRNKIMKI